MRILLIMLIALMPVVSHAATRAETDAAAVEIYRAGVAAAVAQVKAAAGGAKRKLGAQEKDAVRRAWSSFLDYVLALDSIGAYHRQQKGAPSLAVTYAAFLAEYRSALEMIDAATRRRAAREPQLPASVPADVVISDT